MDLKKIIRLKISKLKKEYNKIMQENALEKYNEALTDIEYFIANSSEDAIVKLDWTYLDKTFGRVFRVDKQKRLNTIKEVKLVMEAKYENGIQIDLTENQKLQLNSIINKFKEEVLKLQKKIDEYKSNYNLDLIDNLELTILQLEDLYDKIIDGKNKDLLNEEEFQLIYENIVEDKDIDYETKKELLIGFAKYNRGVAHKDVVSLESVIECLNKYNLPELIPIARKNEDLINSKADLESMDEILNFFKTKDILYNFNSDTLFSVILSGNIELIKKTMEKFNANENDRSLFFITASFWLVEGNSKKGKRLSKSLKKLPKVSPYIMEKYGISYDEFKENEMYLLELGFNVSGNQKVNMKTLKTQNEKIKQNIKYYKLYEVMSESNVKDFPASAISFSRVDDKCDIFIELGLLDYLKKTPTAIANFSDEVLQKLYKLKRELSDEEFYNLVMSDHKKGSVKTVIYKNKFEPKLFTSIEKEQFIKENFIDYTEEKYIPNYNNYEDIILADLDERIDEGLLNNKLINNLETNYKIDKFKYKFGNQIISRYKVLRTLTAFLRNNICINEETLIYSIVRNTYIDEKTFDEISKSIGYGIGETHKWNI